MARLHLVSLVSLVALTGCADKSTDGTGNVDSGTVSVDDGYVDADNDGYGSDEDCDDNDASVNEGSAEVCDGVDNNCDGEVDEGVSNTYYRDADGDGFGDESTTSDACESPEGYVPNGNDCDDANTDVYPGNEEVCDGLDNNCDGDVDEGVTTTYYADSDLDGYGDPETEDEACSQPTGYVEDNSDCDDSTDAAFPDNLEVCDEIDNDCDGDVDEGVTSTYYADVDGDGFGDPEYTQEACARPTGYSSTAGDCDDSDGDVNPDELEVCDDIDNNCDGDIDEDTAVDVSTWYADADGDGYGDSDVTDIDCEQPTGYVADATDCDDTESTTNPGALEYCDGHDDDCDGDTDEDDSVDVSTWYRDSDSDGYGDADVTDTDCYEPTGYVSDNTDCDDDESTTNPAASEYCDGHDDDCDGDIDEDDSVDVSTWYRDSDSDGYGDNDVTDTDCYEPTGYVSDNTDCDDGESTTNPSATEYCDGHDDDCDGDVDEDDSADVSTWYRDSDGDGYGDNDVTDTDCYEPTGYVSDNTDCDDGESTTNPGALEYCDGHDDDCDGDTDEDDSVDVSTWYRDYDSDGYGDADTSDIDCYEPSGYTSDNQDCDDRDEEQYPGADEYCNSEDDDCDGDIDEDGEVVDGDTFYLDNDGDETGDPDNTIVACDAPSGYVDNSYDCNDSNVGEPVVVDAATGSASGSGTMSSPFDAIQDGVDDAEECVIVFGGTYEETLDLSGVGIDVWGVEGTSSTTIDSDGVPCDASDPDGCEPTVTIAGGSGATATLRGFTITGGTGYTTSSSSSQTCADSSSSHGGDNTCTVNVYTFCGGGIYIDGDDPNLEDIVVRGNDLPAFEQTSIASFEQNWVYSYGGGICAMDTTASLDGVKIQNNYADVGGGVYVADSSALTHIESFIQGNDASDGAGYAIASGSASLTNVIVGFNDAETDGGGVFLDGGSATVTNSSFGHNTSSTSGTSRGDAVYMSAGTTATVMNSIITTDSANYVLYTAGTLTASYNDWYNFGSGGRLSGASAGTGSKATDCDFTSVTDDGNYNNDDWSLYTGSACIDTGNPATAYYDSDGTRNDMGAFGGPNSDWND